MKNMTIVCDECGAQKREVNHWYRIGADKGRFAVEHFDGPELYARETADICGQECMAKAFARWLSTGSIFNPSSVVNDLIRALYDIAQSPLEEL